MPEVKHPKSWGNGYLRFTAMDLVKLVTFLATVGFMWHDLATKQSGIVIKQTDVIRRVEKIEEKVGL